MIFDTGSPNLWVVSAQPCKSTLTSDGSGYKCEANHRYNHNTSSTYVADGSEYQAAYGAGDVEGFYSRDLLFSNLARAEWVPPDLARLA